MAIQVHEETAGQHKQSIRHSTIPGSRLATTIPNVNKDLANQSKPMAEPINAPKKLQHTKSKYVIERLKVGTPWKPKQLSTPISSCMSTMEPPR
jgi:hypothetical protein